VHRLERLPIEYISHFATVNGYSFYRYHVTKKWNFAQLELTFTEFCVELMFSQSLKHNAKMSLMFFSVLGIDYNVINENNDKLVQFHHEYGVHQIHEVSRGIGPPKRHNQIFINAISGRESHLRDIFLIDFDLMITRSKINLGKHFSACKLIEQEVDAGNGYLFLIVTAWGG
jgi:hypothetical protein